MSGSAGKSDQDQTGGIDRRRFLTAGAGFAAAVGLGLGLPACGGAGSSSEGSERGESGLVPAERRGIQLYSVRDAIGRAPDEYPTLPSGYRQVFEALAELGYGAVEGFSQGAASFRQHPDAEGGAEPSPRLIKRWLDENGLLAAGHYGKIDPATIEPTLDLAEALGTPLVGSVDPIPYPCSNQKRDWDGAAAEWNVCAKRAAARGIRIYAHAHWRPWDFLRDAGPPDAAGRRTRSTGIRSMEYWLDRTDPDWVCLEMDTYWAFVARSLYPSYVDPEGHRREAPFDPLATALKYRSRCPVFHAKDGVAATVSPPGFEGEYVWAPFGAGELPLAEFFRRILSAVPGDVPRLNVEQDNGPAATGGSLAEPIVDPGKSLRDAATSLHGLAAIGK